MRDMRDSSSLLSLPPSPPPPLYLNSPPTHVRRQGLEPLPSSEGCGPGHFMPTMAQDDHDKGLLPPRHDEEGDDEEGVTTMGEGLPPQRDANDGYRHLPTRSDRAQTRPVHQRHAKTQRQDYATTRTSLLEGCAWRGGRLSVWIRRLEREEEAHARTGEYVAKTNHDRIMVRFRLSFLSHPTPH